MARSISVSPDGSSIVLQHVSLLSMTHCRAESMSADATALTNSLRSIALLPQVLEILARKPFSTSDQEPLQLRPDRFAIPVARQPRQEESRVGNVEVVAESTE